MKGAAFRMYIDHENRGITGYGAKLNITLSYNEAVALCEQIRKASENYYAFEDEVKENCELTGKPYLGTKIDALEKFGCELSNQISLIDSSENATVNE